MAAKKPQHPLRDSEIERFERSLQNWLKTSPDEAAYHQFHGILTSQIVTLQICGVITRQGATKLLMRMSEARLERDSAQGSEQQ